MSVSSCEFAAAVGRLDAPKGCKAVLCVLQRVQERLGGSAVSVSAIADEAGYSRRGCGLVLGLLVDLGLIERWEAPRRGVLQSVNCYAIQFGKIFGAVRLGVARVRAAIEARRVARQERLRQVALCDAEKAQNSNKSRCAISAQEYRNTDLSLSSEAVTEEKRAMEDAKKAKAERDIYVRVASGTLSADEMAAAWVKLEELGARHA